LTPSYDITFSPSADGYKRRRKKDQYDYFRMLPGDTKIDVVFFGGKDYLPLFCSLTEAISCKKIVFFKFCERAAGQQLHAQTFRNDHANQLALRVCQRCP
jgi:hypothetical protein